MEKKHKIIIGIILLVILFLIGYIKGLKYLAIKTIKKYSSGSNEDAMKDMDRGYLIERAKAFKKGSDDFTFKNVLYDTRTGRGKTIAPPPTTKKTVISKEDDSFDIFDYETWF